MVRQAQNDLDRRTGVLDERHANARGVGDEILQLALFAVRVLRCIRFVVSVDFRGRDGDRRKLAAAGVKRVTNLRALRAAAILRFGSFRRDDDGVRERALDLVDRDLVRELVFEFRR